MSKKYIITIKSEYEDSFKGLMILGAKDSNLFVDALAVEDLEELNSDYINENFGDLQDTAYQKGFEDGKAVNDKGCEGCKLQGTDSNICDQCRNSYANQWKKNDEKIVVGDEVKWNDDLVVITRFCDDPQWLDGIDKDGTAYHILKLNAQKTGRHYDIEKLLEAMKA